MRTRSTIRADSSVEIIGLKASIRANTECVGECRIGAVAPMSDTLRMARSLGLAPSARDRISVDLHGLKAALVARAHALRVDVSAVVRRAVERELGVTAATTELAGKPCGPRAAGSTVKLSIRLTSAQAQMLVAGAQRAGLSRGAYLADLLAGIPLPTDGSASRPERLAALNASCAELSTLSRNLHHLTSLLRQGQVRPALEYRAMLDTIGGDVREHLQMAAGLLAELRPARPACAAMPRRPGATA